MFPFIILQKMQSSAIFIFGEKKYFNISAKYELMLYSQLYEKLTREIAPCENGLSDDIYGLQFGSLLKDHNLHTIVICLDPTKDVIIQAIKLKAHLIISHHGLTHHPIQYFNDTVLDQISLLSMNQMSLFVMHTAWDASPGGISETLTRISGLEIEDNLYFNDKGRKKPIGRIGRPIQEKTSVKQIATSLKRHLNLEAVQIGGNPDAIVKKAAIVGGKGLSSDKILDIIAAGCDTFISGEFTYPEYLSCKSLGLNLIGAGH
mgnify:CR=1 FL=1